MLSCFCSFPTGIVSFGGVNLKPNPLKVKFVVYFVVLFDLFLQGTGTRGVKVPLMQLTPQFVHGQMRARTHSHSSVCHCEGAEKADRSHMCSEAVF